MIVRMGGPHSVVLSKVKGHATDDMVKEGNVRLSDKQGSDKADIAADVGATSSHAKVHAFGSMYRQRQKGYRTLVCRVQNYIVEPKAEEKKLREEAAKKERPIGLRSNQRHPDPEAAQIPGGG